MKNHFLNIIRPLIIFRFSIFSLMITFSFGHPAIAQVYSKKNPLVHTYSIVARDAATGEMAVGVQSHWFSVGSVVSWGEAGVGVIATQSFVNKSFGIRGLDLLKQGHTPEEALEILLSENAEKEVRQVAILSNQGNIATHTGKNCIEYAGHSKGKDFSVQANMMLSDKVWPAMAKAFEVSDNLPLAERVIAAMEAAEKAGGDIRGKQSAALLVVRGISSSEPWNDRLIDLRVEDHKDPVKELDRLLRSFRAYEHMDQGDEYMAKGMMSEALGEYQKAQTMLPKNLEMKYWHAITLANNKEIEAAIDILRRVYKEDKNWKILTNRLPEAGLLNLDQWDLERILNVK
ncbi:hypothetical protein BH23BAC1_BH23BAC1_35140 [soil metagenome]